MKTIPEKTRFKYSGHAKREWLREEHGPIQHYPKMFTRESCKDIIDNGDNTYKFVYRYDDRYDLILVVNKQGEVITNYKKINLDNKHNLRGMFYVNVNKKYNG